MRVCVCVCVWSEGSGVVRWDERVVWWGRLRLLPHHCSTLRHWSQTQQERTYDAPCPPVCLSSLLSLALIDDWFVNWLSCSFYSLPCTNYQTEMRGRDGRHDMHPCQISNYCSHVISGVSLRLCTYSYSGYFPHFVHDIASLADPCVSPFAEYKKVYSVSQQKSPPYGFLKFFPKRLGIFS